MPWRVNITGVLVKECCRTGDRRYARRRHRFSLIGVTGLGTGTANITGLLDDYTVEVFSASNFDRLTIKNADPDSRTTASTWVSCFTLAW